jgi:hypothetical protein
MMFRGTPCIGGSKFAGDRRKAGDQFRFFADFGKDLGLGVLRDIVRDCKGAMGAPAFSVNDTLGNPYK